VDPLSELQSLIRRHAGGARRATALDGVTVMAANAPTAPLTSMTEPALAVVASGAKRTVVGDRVYAYGAGQCLVASLDLPVTAHITQATAAEPFLGVGLTLRPAAIAALLLDAPAPARNERRANGPATAAAGMPAAGPAPAGGTPAGIAVSDAGDELLDAIVRLLRLLDRPEDAQALAPLYEREILWRLITGEHGAAVRQIGLAGSSLSQISRAVSWIRRHHDETIRIDELARLSGMSPSSLHRHFRAATEMTPIQYQKQVRLQEARERLIAQPEDVASVGFAVGYNSASQFSREYSRLFGAPPGKDAALLREASAAGRE
jgi:AraC-like DNA-binding protein